MKKSEYDDDDDDKKYGFAPLQTPKRTEFVTRDFLHLCVGAKDIPLI